MTNERICSKCGSAPTLTPNLSRCRACLKAEVDRDRENRAAAQRLALGRARESRTRPRPVEEAGE